MELYKKGLMSKFVPELVVLRRYVKSKTNST